MNHRVRTSPAWAVRALALLAVLAAPAAHAGGPPRWTFMDLGALFNTAEAIPRYSVNDLGQVAGSGVQAFVQGAPRGPFITGPNSPVNWAPRPGDPARFVDEVAAGTYGNEPLGAVLAPSPYAVNDLAICTGRGYSYPHDMAFLGSHAQTLAIGPSSAVCHGYAINDASAVAGVIGAGDGWVHAVHIAGAVTTDLGTFRTLPPTRDNDRSEAYGINASGTVVGYAATDEFSPGLGGNALHAFKWTPATGLVDLGTAGGPLSQAFDINDAGEVVGFAYDAAFNQLAVRWSAANALSVIAAAPPVYPQLARWITGDGWVIGSAHVVPIGPGGYFLQYQGGLYDMATLIDDDGTHWTDLVFTDVNAIGQITGYGTNDHTPFGARRAFLLTSDRTTATALALVDAEATAGLVRLRWHGPERDLRVIVERREDPGVWAPRAELAGAGHGTIEFLDRDVVAGREYGYRLAVTANGGTTHHGETWVQVPEVAALALRGFAPNPSPGAPRVAFTLPQAGAASLEVVDVAGRRVEAREWSALAAGSHVVPLGSGRFRPGVYGLRLTFAGRTVTRTGVVTEP